MNRKVKLLFLLGIAWLFSEGCAHKVTISPFMGKVVMSHSREGFMPKHDGIAGIAVSPENPDVIFCLTEYSGIYKSSDGGRTFRHLTTGLPDQVRAGSFPHYLNNGITIDRKNPKVIYVSFNGEIYKSIDEGESWIWSSKGTTVMSYDFRKKANFIMGIIIDPQDSNHLLATTIASGFFGGVFESKDGGKNWQHIAGLGVPSSGIENDAWPICFDPSNPKRVYACGVHEVFYYSTDGGYKWIHKDPRGEKESSASSIFVFPNAPNQVLLGDTRGPFLSEDYGKTWKAYKPLKGCLTSIETTQSYPNIIYAVSSSDGILYRTTDGGKTWIKINHKDKGLRNVAVDPKDPFTIYLGSYSNGLYKSIDGGENLSRIGEDLPEGCWTNLIWIAQILPDPKDHNLVYAVEWESGLYESTDKGKTWRFIRYARCGEVAVSNDTIYLSDLEGLHCSKDKGKTWKLLYELEGRNLTFTISPHNNEEIWVVDNATYKVFISKDGGRNWHLQSVLDPKIEFATRISIDPQEPSRIYLATYNYPLRSDDEGKTWNVIKRRIKGGYTKEIIKSLVVGPLGEIYIISQGGGWFKSINYGRSWKNITPPGVKGKFYSGQISLHGTSTVFITSESGLFLSYNKGETWQKLMETPVFYAFAIDPHQSNRFYAGGEEGIYKIHIIN